MVPALSPSVGGYGGGDYSRPARNLPHAFCQRPKVTSGKRSLFFLLDRFACEKTSRMVRADGLTWSYR
jgi:hypothetical protein